MKWWSGVGTGASASRAPRAAPPAWKIAERRKGSVPPASGCRSWAFWRAALVAASAGPRQGRRRARSSAATSNNCGRAWWTAPAPNATTTASPVDAAAPTCGPRVAPRYSGRFLRHTRKQIFKTGTWKNPSFFKPAGYTGFFTGLKVLEAKQVFFKLHTTFLPKIIYSSTFEKTNFYWNHLIDYT